MSSNRSTRSTTWWPVMGSTGSCYDNAITESFFHTLKTELVYLTKFETRDLSTDGIIRLHRNIL
ncbi:MAG: IS3 family transposase [Acidobacteriota bacterium]